MMISAPAFADVKDGVDAWGRGDYDAAVAQWRGPAAKGDPDAMFNMGQAYKMGRGVPKDPAKAESFYRAAAQKGHVQAADNLGILLFQNNRQSEAMPMLEASARRGEPRAMYILGIAAYNGDYAQQDLVRAYALMSRAAGAGLPQASTSLKAMDEAIPLSQRQQGIALAQQMDQQATAARSADLAGADLGAAPAAAAPPVQVATGPIQSVPIPASRPAAPAGPVTAGADYANPVTLPPRVVAKPAPVKPAPVQIAAASPVPKPKPEPAPKLAAKPAETGGWRIQLGAFGQKSNADALWAKLKSRPEVAGHPRIDSPGAVSRLQAGGYSEASAKAACETLKAAGQTCIVVNH